MRCIKGDVQELTLAQENGFNHPMTLFGLRTGLRMGCCCGLR